MRQIKRSLYFLVARWFAFWAYFYLRRWKPMVIAVIGSSGKTTLLHLLEAQLGSKAKYSHKANSAFGIPFNILGLERKSFGIFEWPLFALLAPFRAFRSPLAEKIYVAEADAERPGEGQLLAELLRPEATIWLSLEEAHGINFDRVAEPGVEARTAVKDEMAREFGYFLEWTKNFCVLNADNDFIIRQTKRTLAKITLVSKKEVRSFRVAGHTVVVETLAGDFKLPALVPPAAALSVLAVALALKTLEFPLDPEFKNLSLPPGRSSVFRGLKNTTLLDSTYNATMDGMRTMLDLFSLYSASSEKWLVLGDMIEQGKSEEAEHKDIANNIVDASPARVVLVGPRLQKHTEPIVAKWLGKEKVVSFLRPDEALIYIQKELKGGEIILFKGARFLEGIVERLLADPADALKLCRREPIWQKKRAEWGV